MHAWDTLGILIGVTQGEVGVGSVLPKVYKVCIYVSLSI
jgi:hypothetical protein